METGESSTPTGPPPTLTQASSAPNPQIISTPGQQKSLPFKKSRQNTKRKTQRKSFRKKLLFASNQRRNLIINIISLYR
eukprot:UN11199